MFQQILFSFNLHREDIFGEPTNQNQNQNQSDLVKSQEIKSYVSEGESEKPNKTKIDIIIPSVPIQSTGVKGKEKQTNWGWAMPSSGKAGLG